MIIIFTKGLKAFQLIDNDFILIDWHKQKSKLSNHMDVNGRSGDLPVRSAPVSSRDLYVNGKLWQRRYYDSNGAVVKDIDYWHGNPEAHTFPHEHYWSWSNGKPLRPQ